VPPRETAVPEPSAGPPLIPPHLAPPPGRYTEAELANRRAVLEYYELAVNRHDLDAAETYQGDHYIQHDPNVRDGAEGLRELSEEFTGRFPDLRIDIERVFVEGDMVALHVRWSNGMTPGGEVGVDMFRLDNGKVVEHWGVVQPVPGRSANPNPII
jgi:predicted SnoaL-like aldol condensation-catalyzing enzyme